MAELLQRPWREGACPACGGRLTIQRLDGGSWAHTDSDPVGCNAIVKIEGDNVIVIARRFRFFTGPKK